MFLYLDTLYWFRAKNILFLLLNAECLAEKQQYQSTALEASMLTFTTLVQPSIK
jgi:hypothetical protein